MLPKTPNSFNFVEEAYKGKTASIYVETLLKIIIYREGFTTSALYSAVSIEEIDAQLLNCYVMCYILHVIILSSWHQQFGSNGYE